MNVSARMLRVALCVAFIPSAVPSPASAAQPASSGTSSSQEETIVLSPFEVNATNDSEYLATESLGGTRLNTSLRDIPSQVSVMTAEFLDDLALTNLEDAFRYSLNVESAAEAIDITNTATAGAELSNNPISGGRTRGLGRSNRSHDFFGTVITADTYNTERFTFSSGPNAILFGNSNPTGTIDTTFKRARLNNESRSVTIRVDSEGSLRGVLDLNQPIFRDKLALRIAGMKEQRNDFRDPAYEKEQRFYATATYRPLKQIQLRGWYEAIDRFRQPARATLLQDKVTPWIAAGRPLFNNASVANGGPAAMPATPTSGPNSANYDPVFASRPEPTRPIFAFDQSGPAFATGLWSRAVQTRGFDSLRAAPDNFDVSLTDSGVFPLDTAISGNGIQNDTHAWIRGALLEVNPVRHLFIEAGYNEEQFRYRNVDYVNNTNSDLWVDANRFLADGVTPNPYVGRYYIEGTPQGVKRLTRQREHRVAVSYELDFTKRQDWARWLGRHRAAVLGSRAETSSLNQSQDLRIVSDHAFTPTSAAENLNHASRQAFVRAYVADPQNPSAGGSYYFNLPYNAFHPGRIPGTDVDLAFIDNPFGSTSGTGGSRTTVESRVLALQNFLLKDRVVLTWGWRRDDVDVDSVNSLGTQRIGTSAQSGFIPIEQVVNYGDAIWNRVNSDSPATRLRGVVVHPLRWLSLHYNESATNSTPNFSRSDLDGGSSELSDGEGKDYGFSVRLFDGALSVRINRYTNTSDGALSGFRGPTPTATGQGSNNIRDNVFHLERTVLALGAPFSERFRAFEDAVVETPLGSAQNRGRDVFDVLSDEEAKGTEIQIAGRLRPQWSVSVSYAENETRESNIARAWFELIQERLPIWSEYLDVPLHQSATVTLRQYLPRAIQNWNYIRLAEGTPNFQESKHRLNVTTRYRFDEGRFKGLFVGGHYHWRAAPKIGFGQVTIDDNPFVIPGLTTSSIAVSDVENPILGRDIESFELFAGYRKKLFKGRVNWNVQLNIRNVFDDDALITQRAISTGQGAIFRMQPPRTFILTNTFAF